jgi:hypothetical protein
MWKYLVQDSSLSVLKAIDSAETWFQADTKRMTITSIHANSPLPYKMYDLCEGIDFDSLDLVTLDSLQEGMSPLFEIQNEGSNYAIERDRILYKQIDLWLEDEEDTVRYEKVSNLLRLTPTLQAKFELIDYLVMLKEIQEADYLLDSIGTADSDWSSFTDIYRALLPIISNPGSWYNLPTDSVLVTNIYSLVEQKLPGAGRLVSLLDFCLDRFSCEEIQTLKIDASEKERYSKQQENTLIPKSKKEILSIFPNPNNGFFTVLYSSPDDKLGKLTLHNSIGNALISGISIHPNIKLDLNMGDIPSGVYILRVQQDNKLTTQKIIIR